MKQFLVQVVCVIPKEMFTSGKLSQLQAPDPSSVQGSNLVFYVKLLQPPLNKTSFCLNSSWHHQEQNSSLRLIWLKPKSRLPLRSGKAGKLVVISPSMDKKEVTESALPQKTHYYSQKDNYTWTWTIRGSIPFGGLTMVITSKLLIPVLSQF